MTSSVPIARAEVVQVAWSGELSLSATFWHCEIGLPPTEKSTVPVGVPGARGVAVTVSVNVWDAPTLSVGLAGDSALVVATAGEVDESSVDRQDVAVQRRVG